MRFRTDVRDLIILAGIFQEFDHYKVVEQLVPASSNLQVGDRIRWKCGQFYGIAEIVKREGFWFSIKKIS